AGKHDLRDVHLTSFIDSRQKAAHFLVLAAPLVHNQEVYSLLALAGGANIEARNAMERLYGPKGADRTSPGEPEGLERRPQPRKPQLVEDPIDVQIEPIAPVDRIQMMEVRFQKLG